MGLTSEQNICNAWSENEMQNHHVKHMSDIYYCKKYVYYTCIVTNQYPIKYLLCPMKVIQLHLQKDNKSLR